MISQRRARFILRAGRAMTVFMLAVGCFHAAHADDYWKRNGCVRSLPEPTLSSRFFPGRTFVLDQESGKGIENVTVNKGLKLTVVNSGCEYFVLEYHFKFQGKMPQGDVKFWYEKAVDSIDAIVDANTSPANLKKARDAIRKYLNSENPKFGEEIEMSKNVMREFIVVNTPVQDGGEAVLKVDFNIAL